MTKTIRATTIVFTLSLVALAGAQERQDRFSRTLDVGPDGELSLENVSGDIEVTGTDGSQIVIEAEKRYHGSSGRDRAADVDIDVSQMGNRVRVETRYLRGRHDHGGGVSVRYTVSVPRGTRVELQSVSGDVTLSAVQGEALVRSVSGSVAVRDVGSLSSAKSVSGGVSVRGARSAGETEIASVSGDVSVEDIEARELSVESVSGDVVIDGASCERGNLSSVSGDLRYTGRIAKGGRYELESHSGDVVLTLAEAVGFELEASTFSGDIESDFPLQVRSRDERGRKLEGVFGDGSAFIEASTFSGDIRLRER
jgi:DUF4097 and DUF4098 domain-containing protein YvlB